MSDPVFAAEMATLAAERRAREKGRIGDGMAALGIDPKNPNAWMDFSGPRVPVSGSSAAAGAVSIHELRSPRHVHDDDCLTAVAGGIRPLATGESREVPEPGWFECSHNGARYHRHADRLMAHWIRNRLACPDGIQ